MQKNVIARREYKALEAFVSIDFHINSSEEAQN